MESAVLKFGSNVILVCSIISLLAISHSSSTLVLKSYISEHGLHGTITFAHAKDQKSPLTITTDLNATLEYPNQIWTWGIREFPVDYTNLDNRCHSSSLGKEILSLDDSYGYLILPDNGTSSFSSENLRITGDTGLYGKSVLLRNVETNRAICASIIMGDESGRVEKTAVARFNSPISGTVYFRWFLTKDNRREMLISTDLYRVSDVEKIGRKSEFTEHSWKLYITDILEEESSDSETNCNFLQLVFDPENKGNGSAIGDIDARLGRVKVATNPGKKMYKTLFRDEKLILLPSDITGPQRRLYLVIFANKHQDSFFTCAKIRYDHPVNAKVIIQSGGIKGEIRLSQRTRFEPTFLNLNLTTARGDLETKLVYSSSVAGYRIHELPMTPAKTVGQAENLCLTTKFLYNPSRLNVNMVPPNGFGTQDQYPVGELSGKLLGRNNFTSLVPGSQELSEQYWDVFLPLQGKHSIMHRSLVIYKNTQYSSSEIMSEPWICGTITEYDANFKYQKQIFTAEVLFRYPVVGRILFRQPKGEPWTDTTVIVEYVTHADGSVVNSSMDHRWALHEKAPGKDFYNWTARCLSAGPIFNPYKVDFDNKSTECNAENVGLCRLGDLSTRLGTLDIAGKNKDRNLVSRRMYSDPLLPLTGPNSIMGRSLVLYDDFGPKARGERLACSKIGAVYRRKAVSKDWFPNGDELTVKGNIEFYQQTEYDITNVEVDLEGLYQNSGYHVHITPVEENLEFPCESTSLYDHWNPLNVDPASSPRAYHGTPDQYEMGDLSGKFGTLDRHTLHKQDYNDTMLPLFGPRSILGRSIVIHKKLNDRRWACSTIERGYSPSEAREIRAVASFHHPDGFAYGYMRMTQLIYNDGSKSDTVIEVNLRHPGKHDRNVTRDHLWAIYVNPVGVDASVKTQATRCVAGGYVWNPYYTQLADPLNGDLYNEECGPDNPLRCYVGDVSSRVGTIDVGLRRSVLVDSNFPLEGDVSAVGRSIVLLSPNKRPERYACANIEPDHDIIKYANIERPPRFVVAQFIDDVRQIMGVPEWMLTVDSRKTKVLHGGACVQILLHFKGGIASQLEKDFSKLVSVGRLDSPTLYIPGYFDAKRKAKIGYKQCGMRDPNEKSSRRSGFYSSSGQSSTKIQRLTSLVLVSSVMFSARFVH